MRIISFFSLLFLLTACGTPDPPASKEVPPPNVIIVLTDDQG